MTKQDRHEVVAGVMVGDGAWPGKVLAELCALIGPVFAQARSRLVAFAYVAALLAVAGDRKSCWQPPTDIGLIRMTVPEARRLFALPARRASQAFHHAWSIWRRRHQARARYHHYQAQLRAAAP